MDSPASAPAFTSLGLSAPALAAVAAAGYTTPTPVQVQAIPPVLAGRDVIAIAATGTGKTAAFILPILDLLASRPVAAPVPVRALVLAPTRELVQQIAEAVRTFGGERGFKCAHVVGGVGFDQQIVALRGGREILVATPGRLIDHLQQRTARLDAVEFLVLDEADRMLDMGFMPQIERILRCVPGKRTTLLFSATMGDEVERFAKKCLSDPVRIQTVRSGTVAARAEQRVFHVPMTAKLTLLESLLASVPGTTLVFTRTKSRAERTAKALRKSGYPAARIHGDRSQAQRNAALEAFKTGEARVLVATDVAARGLDIDAVAHVVCFDLSRVPDDHVHRVGRTARAGASGLASSFCAPEELELLREIEKFTRTELPVATVPDGVPASVVPAPEARARPPVPRARGSRPSHGGVAPFVPPEDEAGDRSQRGPASHGSRRPHAPGTGPRHAAHPRAGAHSKHRSDDRRTDRVPRSEARRDDDALPPAADHGAVPHRSPGGHRGPARERGPGSSSGPAGGHPRRPRDPDHRPSHPPVRHPAYRTPRPHADDGAPGSGAGSSPGAGGSPHRRSGPPHGRPHTGGGPGRAGPGHRGPGGTGGPRGPWRPGGTGPRRPRSDG